MIDTVNGRPRLVCDNPNHGAWLYLPRDETDKVIREFARYHGWSVSPDRDLCPQCTRRMP